MDGCSVHYQMGKLVGSLWEGGPSEEEEVSEIGNWTVLSSGAYKGVFGVVSGSDCSGIAVNGGGSNKVMSSTRASLSNLARDCS